MSVFWPFLLSSCSTAKQLCSPSIASRSICTTLHSFLITNGKGKPFQEVFQGVEAQATMVCCLFPGWGKCPLPSPIFLRWLLLGPLVWFAVPTSRPQPDKRRRQQRSAHFASERWAPSYHAFLKVCKADPRRVGGNSLLTPCHLGLVGSSRSISHRETIPLCKANEGAVGQGGCTQRRPGGSVTRLALGWAWRCVAGGEWG